MVDVDVAVKNKDDREAIKVQNYMECMTYVLKYIGK